MGVKLILAPIGMSKRVCPPMFFVQSSTPTPRMHQKLTEHGQFCMQNIPLLAKNLVDLKDNYIDDMNFLGFKMSLYLRRYFSPETLIIVSGSNSVAHL